MLEITLKLVLGVFLGGISFYGLLANILVALPVFRLAFTVKRSPIYVISLVNIFADVFNLLLTLCYLVPIILKTAYVSASTTDFKVSVIFGTGFMFCWYLGSITQIIMAINRLVVICFKNQDIFTRKVLIVIFLFIFPLCIAMTYLAQFGFPCCALVYDSRILSISYLDTGVENFSNKFIDVPLNFSTSMTAFVCYSLITIKIWRSKKLTVTAGGLQTSSGNKEYAFIIVPFDVTLIYVFHGLCQFTGPLSCKISLSIFYHCFPHNVWSLLLSFSYRYYVLHHHQLSRRVLVLIILIIYMPSLTQALVYWPSIADKEDIMPYANRFYPQYNLSNADGLLAGIPTIREFASIFVIGHLCIPIFPIYITIFVLRHKVMKELLKKTAMLSRDAKSYHSQILKCLTIQAIIPLIFVIGVMSYISAQLGIFTNPFLEYSIFACTLPMPMFSPFTYLLYIQPYRMFCLRLIKRKEGESSQAERSKQVLSL